MKTVHAPSAHFSFDLSLSRRCLWHAVSCLRNPRLVVNQMKSVLFLIGLCATLAACTETPASQQNVADKAIASEAITAANFVPSFQTLCQAETRKLETALLATQKPALLRFREPFGGFSPKEDDCGQCYSEYAIALNDDEAVLLIHLGGSAVLPSMAAYRVSRHPPYPAKPLQLPGIVNVPEQTEQFPHIGHNLGIDAETGIIWQGIYDDQPMADCEGCGDIDRQWRFDGQDFQLTKATDP